MHSFCINKYNKPVGVCTPDVVRHLFNNNKAKIVSHSPFIIKTDNYCGKKLHPLVFNIDISFTTIMLSIYHNGIIYFYKEFNLLSSYDKLTDNLKGLFLLIYKYIAIDNINISINGSILYFYDLNTSNEHEFKNKQRLLNDVIYKEFCLFCHRELIKTSYKIYKVYNDISFYGNNFLVCYNCTKRLNTIDSIDYIKVIKDMFILYTEIKLLLIDVYLMNKEANNATRKTKID